MNEKIDAHELSYWKDVQTAMGKLQTKLEALSEMLTVHWQLKEGDTVDPVTGTITRKVVDVPVADTLVAEPVS